MSAPVAAFGCARPFWREHTLFWCLLASIALHAAILLALPREHVLPRPTPPLVLTARVVPIVTAPAQTAPSPAKTEQAPEPAPAAQPKTVPKAETEPTLVPAPKPKPAAHERTHRPLEPRHPAVRKAEPAKPQSIATPPEPAPVPVAAAAALAAQAPAASPAPVPAKANLASAAPSAGTAAGQSADLASDVDPRILDGYRLALIAATKRYKRYPAIAIEKGWEGRVEVRLMIGANGMLSGTSIQSSSGHAILDKQAIDMLRKGKTTVEIPVVLRGRKFSIDVPVIFSLDGS